MPPAFCFPPIATPAEAVGTRGVEACLCRGFELSNGDGDPCDSVGKVAGKTPAADACTFVRAEQGLALDFGSMAGPSALCRDSCSADPALHRGPGTVERP